LASGSCSEPTEPKGIVLAMASNAAALMEMRIMHPDI
jgi:hypothetical protein